MTRPPTRAGVPEGTQAEGKQAAKEEDVLSLLFDMILPERLPQPAFKQTERLWLLTFER